MNQWYIYILWLFLRFSSHIDYYRVLSRVPVLYRRFLLAIYLDRLVCIFQSQSVSLPLPFHLSLLVTLSLFAICVILFLLCKELYLYQFYRSHIYMIWYDMIWYFSLSVTSLSLTISRSIRVTANGIISFLWLSIIHIYIYIYVALLFFNL